METSRRKLTLAALILIPLYLGPYAYVFGMTSADVFPRVEDLDRRAMNKLSINLEDSIRALPPQTRSGTADGQTDSWVEVTYAFRILFLNRIFPTYITFPALLDISRVTFEASGVLNGTVIFTCSQYVERLIAPTGFEAISLYGSILRSQNNTLVSIFCTGPGPPTVDFVELSQAFGSPLPILLSWTLTATLKGEKVEETRNWFGNKNAQVVLP